MSIPEKPITRRELYLAKAAGQSVTLPEEDKTREEQYLRAIAEGGGGGDVTKEYVDTSIANAVEAVEGDISEVAGAVENKVDKVTGKGLSTNDYTDAEKATVQNSPITVTGTGTDLTLSTAEGKPQKLTVYGKSEVVDGAIVSAGEGWATVDLGTLDWVMNNTSQFFALLSPYGVSDGSGATLICSKYLGGNAYSSSTADKVICVYGPSHYVWVKDSDYTDATAFKNSLNGVLLCYQLADPTQGNVIAVKTDDGTGIDGTMWTFETGTPLRGIPDTTVRDSAVCDGSAGTVTKVCGSVRLADLTWIIAINNRFVSSPPNCYHAPNLQTYPRALMSTNKYTPKTPGGYNTVNYSFYISLDGTIGIKDIDYTTVSDFVASLGDAELVYELATPTTTPLTSTEIQSFNDLRTYEPQTHIANNAGAEMTASAYANTENGKAVAELDAKTQITTSGTLTLTVAGWSNNTQTVTYAHDTAKRNVIDVDPASVEEWASCGVLAISETAAGITFKCATVPTNALNFAVTAMGVSV